MLNRFSLRGVMLLSCVALGFSTLGVARVSAQPWQNGGGQPNDGPPVYQQHPVDGHPSDRHRRDDRRDRRDFRRDSRFASPQVSAAWFQRPYPYHLDYYKMRYGGSYAPYFGNLYGTPFGTPQVVNGGWGPGAGDAGPNGGGYPPPQGYEWMDGGASPYAYPPGAMMELQAPATETNTQNGATQQKSESLPAPSK